jgi:hypothetical protein
MGIHLQMCPVYFQASIVGSVVECSPATRAARVRFPDDANLFLPLHSATLLHIIYQSAMYTPGGAWSENEEKSFGDAGYRSPYLSHAKRALYHLSYVPFI